MKQISILSLTFFVVILSTVNSFSQNWFWGTGISGNDALAIEAIVLILQIIFIYYQNTTEHPTYKEHRSPHKEIKISNLLNFQITDLYCGLEILVKQTLTIQNV